MKVSLQTVQAYLPDSLPPVEELLPIIGSQLGAVESVTALASRYEGVVVARVIECAPLENSDHLMRCFIDDNRVIKGVDRTEQGWVQVITGAPNVREDLLVAWLPPGVTVPSSYGTSDPFVMESRPLRGAISHGMLASAKELAIGESHEGILDLSSTKAVVGDMLAEVLQLNDTIVDIENKMFTHRPDCFGQLGIARELAGVLHRPFHSPPWYLDAVTLPPGKTEQLPLTIQNEIPALVPRFCAVVVSGVNGATESPLWLQSSLSRLGIRPISLIVDITNYVMLITGQPLHAYDYDKVAVLSDDTQQARIIIRNPHSDEKLTLLNGITITPRSSAIMIASDTEAIGLGGVMGGASTEVDQHTNRIILEVATFDMFNIRRTSMEHGIFSEAVTRFTKGQSPLQNDRVLAYAASLLQDLTKGSAQIASRVIDDNQVTTDVLRRQSLAPAIQVAVSFINARLGLTLSGTEIATILENVECSVIMDDQENLTITGPFWRTDLELPEDIVEEVGRLYGFDKIPLALPKRPLTPPVTNQLHDLRTRIRHILAAHGANEVLTYSFIHGKLLERVGQNPEQAFMLTNALSPDLQYYRLSLIPSLLEKVHANIKAGYGRFSLFELGKVYQLTEIDAADRLPKTMDRLALVYTADPKHALSGAAYYQAKRMLEELCHQLSLGPLDFRPVTADIQALALFQPFHSARAAAVFHSQSNTLLGVVGEFQLAVQKQLKLPVFTAGFELSTSQLLALPQVNPYTPSSRYPSISQDICLQVANDVTYLQVANLVEAVAQSAVDQDTHLRVKPVDIYRTADDAPHKQITLRLTLSNFMRTLTDEAVSKLLDKVSEQAVNELSAVRI